MKEELQLKLQAWVDGELAGADAEKMARLAGQDAEARILVAELRGMKAALAGAEMDRAVPETREFYWSKIARQIEAETRREPAPVRSSISLWRRFLMPVAGAATVACVALFTLNQHPKSGAYEPFSSTDEAMETTTFTDQANGLTVVWLQDKAEPAPKPAAPAPKSNDFTPTD